MKIKFSNQDWFEFVKNELPSNTRITKNLIERINASCDAEFIVAKSVGDLVKFIESFSTNNKTKQLGDHTKLSGQWNAFKLSLKNSEKEIRFCHSPDFDSDKCPYDRLYKPGRFLENFTLDTSPPIDFKEEEKEEKKMANNSGIWGMTKEDFKDGLWRNGANEMVEVVKFGILKACKAQKMNRIMYETVRKTLDYKVVTGGIHAALGYALTYAPMLSSHPHAPRMAKELRVEGFKFIQSEVIDAIKDLVPDLLKILSSVSPEEETERRLEVEDKNETRRISAPELTEHQATIEAIAEKETVQAKRTTSTATT